MSKVTADAIIIDRAAAADLGRITAIYAEAVTSGTASYELEPPDRAEMQARYEALVSGGFPYLVARDTAGMVLGYAYAGSFRPRPAYRFIVEDSVYVAPEAKGQGIGLALMRRLIEAAQESGFRQMIAVIGDGHAQSPSVRLHEKLGFSHCGRLEGSGYKHGRWLDTVFMQFAMNGGTATPPDPASLPERRFRGR
ncbi:GNAT family N-acetyltransferase [Manganibacter manganicus]|uniref:GNAT family N-acetyltransferase n=1 Tax=Manganibacter manganicus TaxID=1873176 RepID=A0A1V8RVZ6_9HYPH|nr:GNAT family N-acetyltransferase [Pseudaminobacter manganicus]OQM77189.1 GNAT family N-acetyltransferase [Pseudaminobacter manganicus]